MVLTSREKVKLVVRDNETTDNLREIVNVCKVVSVVPDGCHVESAIYVKQYEDGRLASLWFEDRKEV